MNVLYYLVVGLDGEARLRKNLGGLGRTELAYKISIEVPPSRTRVIGEVDLTLPELPETDVVVTPSPEWPIQQAEEAST